MSGRLLHGLLMHAACESGAAARAVISVPVGRNINISTPRWVTVFTRMINLPIVCTQMPQVRGVHLLHVRVDVDTVGIIVVNHSPFRYDHPVIYALLPCIRSFSRTASNRITGPRMRVVDTAELEIRSAQNRYKRSGPVPEPLPLSYWQGRRRCLPTY